MDKEARILIQAFKDKKKKMGLSLRKAADLIGVSFSTLNRLENFECAPDANTKVRLLNWLGSDAFELPLKHEQVAEVHFRAAKQIDSETISHLVIAARSVKQKLLG